MIDVTIYSSDPTLTSFVQTEVISTLQWRHNGRDSVSNHQLHDCLLESFIQTHIQQNVKALPHLPLCGEFTGDRWIPAQMASNAENVPFGDVIMRKSMASRYIFCYLLLRHGHVISSHSFFEGITPHSCSHYNSNLVTTPLNNRDHRHRRHYRHHHLTVVLQYFNESYLFRSTSSIRFVCCAIFLSRQGGLCVSDQTWS